MEQQFLDTEREGGINVVYDAHIFRWQKAGGISRYFAEVISRLPGTWTPALMGLDQFYDNLPRHPRLKSSPLSSVAPRRFTQPLKRWWWKKKLLNSAHIVHPTYYNLTGGLKYRDIKAKVVVTVHDFAHAEYPDLLDDVEATLRDQKEAICRADHIICISSSTETRLVARHPEVSGRTSVIHHGSSFPVESSRQSEQIFEHPTFLFVGGRAGYKNFLFLLRAFAKACQSNKNLRLHIAGPALGAEERWQIHFLGLANQINVSVFPDESRLQNLYRRSVALLYPSCYEGFGLPPLEAMACGTLAVTSDRTSLPEVVGDAGIMLAPDDESLWTECILQTANNTESRNAMIARGTERARMFSWEKSALEHAAVYHQLL